MKCKGLRPAECLAHRKYSVLPAFDIGKIVWNWNSLELLVLIGNAFAVKGKKKPPC